MLYKQSDNNSLSLLIAKREPKALEHLYECHAQVVYNLIFHIVQNQVIAEEILLDTFWQVWKEADQVKERSPICRRLFLIAHRKSVEHLRQQRAQPPRAYKGWLSPLKKSISTFVEAMASGSMVKILRSKAIISAK